MKKQTNKTVSSDFDKIEQQLFNSYKIEQIEEFREIFKMYDRSNTGSISSRTLKFLLRGLGDNVNEEEVENMLKAMDEDGNGTIDFQQFLLYMLEKVNAQSLSDDIIQIFRVFDRDNTGYITKRQLSTIMGDRLESTLLQQFFNESDLESEGQINYQNYLKSVLKESKL